MRPSTLLIALPLVAALAACEGSPAPQTVASGDTPAQPGSQDAAVPAAAPAGPAVTEPLFGTWAYDLRECGTSPVRISADQFIGAENQCDITALTDNGDGTFTASLACTSQGQSATERIRMTPVFAPTGEGVTLNYLDRGGTEVTLLRCD